MFNIVTNTQQVWRQRYMDSVLDLKFGKFPYVHAKSFVIKDHTHQSSRGKHY
jgi:hypothetical protein